MPINIEHNEQQQILYTTRSEEVQEIIGRMPSWIIRWGIFLVGFIVIGLFIISSVIKYPDKVNANITIISDNPPVQIVATSNARIQKLLVNQNDFIQKGDVLLILENQASLQDVTELKALLINVLNSKQYNIFQHQSFQLGELQTSYTELVEATKNKDFYERTATSNLSISQLQKQIAYNQQLIKQMQDNDSKLYQNYLIDKQIHEVDYKLYKENLLTENDYLKSKKQWLEKQTSLDENKNNIASNTIKQSELSKNIIDIQTEKNKTQYEGICKIEQAIKNLLIQIGQWELKYIVKSPIAGRVNLYSIWKENQFMHAGENIMLVVPSFQNILVKGVIPIQNSGKIKVGQEVMMNLVSHPSNEFGYLKGKISYIATAPMDSVYAFDITLLNGLMTTNNKIIPSQPQLFAQGEILTDKKTLFQRLFQNYNIISE